MTPMMQQYKSIKSRYPDCLLFFRLGDFYELFEEDAEKASRELEIVLTSREAGKNKRVPMCGIPFHAADSYLKRLLDKGYKVAICEQLEEPKPGKTIVKRDVIRVLTPGTVLDPTFLEQTKNNYIISLYLYKETIGCAWSDITTGKYWITKFSGSSSAEYLLDLLNRLQPAECIVKDEQAKFFEAIIDNYLREAGIHLTLLKDKLSRTEELKIPYNHFSSFHFVGIDQNAMEEGILALSNLLYYLQETQKTELIPCSSLSVYNPQSGMYLDAMTRRNLEIFATMRDGKKEGSLLWALDRTLTAMGARLLRNWLGFPLTDIQEIKLRQNAVEELMNSFITREELKEHLKKVYDLERIISRVEWQIAHPRDLLALAKTLDEIPVIRKVLLEANADYLKTLGMSLDPIADIKNLIFRAINDNPPVSLNEGGIIKDQYNEQIDELRQILLKGKEWIRELELKERVRTGIKSLKVGYNKVFGYYIEVTKPNLSLVPPDYIRKQTLTTAERFLTRELKEKEEVFLGATARLQDLEYKIFLEIRQEVTKFAKQIRNNANILAQVDCLLSFAEVAFKHNYTKPKLNNTGIIRIKNGRHPVLEQVLPEGDFVPNDLNIGEPNNIIHILTGPNMAGKSTFMRQMAQIILMTQCGSLIPAEEADIGIVDRIFVRAGAVDDLGRGQSTFMMEMSEVSFIIQHATAQSFIVLDEIGRGTSTFDGLGIAWAIIEYIHEKIGAKTLFATHYHQLTKLEETLSGVSNYSIAVEEKGNNIIFLRKVVPGGTDKSYGIHVARLANLPQSLIKRAEEIINALETKGVNSNISNFDINKSNQDCKSDKADIIDLNDKEESAEMLIINELRKINLIQTTPLDALNIIFSWQQKLIDKRKEL